MGFPYPSLPSGSVIVEHTNGLLKRALKPHNPGWTQQIADAVSKINNCWGVNGCP